MDDSGYTGEVSSHSVVRYGMAKIMFEKQKLEVADCTNGGDHQRLLELMVRGIKSGGSTVLARIFCSGCYSDISIQMGGMNKTPSVRVSIVPGVSFWPE